MFDGIVEAARPLWLTPMAVGDALGLAHAGTALFGFFIFLAALELLRSGSGVIAFIARLLAVFALVFTAAALHYGDFLAVPVRAALTVVTAELPVSQPHAALLATLGVVSVSAAYHAGKSSGISVSSHTSRGSHTRYVSSKQGQTATSGRIMAMDITERLHMRQLARNPRKQTVRNPKSMRTAGPGRNWG
ncbi:MAG: hypothetical protein ABL973_16340 [Micropepsaceae bacterium]